VTRNDDDDDDDDNNNNNNNNTTYLLGPCILDTSSLKETGPRFSNKDPAQVMKLIQIRINLLQGNVSVISVKNKERLMKNGKTSTWYF
jgi:hypothetical protein